MTYGVEAQIRLSALRHNYQVAKTYAEGAQVLAVIKANAYGHGMEAVARALPEADAFGVARLSEGLRLRQAGIDQDVLVMQGVHTSADFQLACQQKLALVIHTAEQLELVEQQQSGSHPFPWLWLKIETGMHRLGFSPNAMPAVINRLQAMMSKTARTPVFMSHFAAADLPGDPSQVNQLNRFLDVIKGIEWPSSMANSGALLARRDARFDWVRPGLMLYGCSPLVDKTGEQCGLQPVMELSGQVISCKQVRPGDEIGYGGTWVAPRKTCIAVISTGYGDGYPWKIPHNMPVWIKGRLYPIVGRVSMDMMTVDIGVETEMQSGDKVVLWGAGLPVERIAQQVGTIPYQLLCSVQSRVAYKYIE